MSEITRVLASDEFQGRAPGTPGEDEDDRLSDRAVQGGRARAGRRERRLDPDGADDPHPAAGADERLGDAGGRRRCRCASPTTSISAPSATIDRAQIANAPMVFVGYGVTAPERGWDDFKGVDLKGKVAVFLVNDPDFEAAAGRAGGRQVRRPDDDLLRPLDLQVRGSGAARRDRRADRPRDRRRRLSAGTSSRAPAGENYNIVLRAGRAAAGAAAGLDPAAGRRRPVQARRATISRR